MPVPQLSQTSAGLPHADATRRGHEFEETSWLSAGCIHIQKLCPVLPPTQPPPTQPIESGTMSKVTPTIQRSGPLHNVPHRPVNSWKRWPNTLSPPESTTHGAFAWMKSIYQTRASLIISRSFTGTPRGTDSGKQHPQHFLCKLQLIQITLHNFKSLTLIVNGSYQTLTYQCCQARGTLNCLLWPMRSRSLPAGQPDRHGNFYT